VREHVLLALLQQPLLPALTPRFSTSSQDLTAIFEPSAKATWRHQKGHSKALRGSVTNISSTCWRVTILSIDARNCLCFWGDIFYPFPPDVKVGGDPVTNKTDPLGRMEMPRVAIDLPKNIPDLTLVGSKDGKIVSTRSLLVTDDSTVATTQTNETGDISTIVKSSSTRSLITSMARCEVWHRLEVLLLLRPQYEALPQNRLNRLRQLRNEKVE
jgi:hypothetical protein